MLRNVLLIAFMLGALAVPVYYGLGVIMLFKIVGKAQPGKNLESFQARVTLVPSRDRDPSAAKPGLVDAVMAFVSPAGAGGEADSGESRLADDNDFSETASGDFEEPFSLAVFKRDEPDPIALEAEAEEGRDRPGAPPSASDIDESNTAVEGEN